MNFLAPFADILLPASVIEQHCAKARVLKVRDDTPPHVIAQLLADAPEHVQEAAHAAAVDASAIVDDLHGHQLDEPHPDPFGCLLDPPAKRAWEFFGAFGGRGGAKTREIATALLELSREHRLKIGCLRSFMNSLQDSVFQTLKDLIREHGWDDEFDIQSATIIHKQTRATFNFAGLQNVDSLKSSTFSIVWIEEAQAGITKDMMTILLPSIREPNSAVIVSWNSDGRCYMDQFLRGPDAPERLELRYCDISHNRHAYRTRLMSEMRTTYRKCRRVDDLADFKHIWHGWDMINAQDAAVKSFTVGAPDIPQHLYAAGQNLYGLDYSNSGHSDADPHHLTVSMAWDAASIYGDVYDPENPYHKPILYVRREWMGWCGTRALATQITRVCGPIPPECEIMADCANGMISTDLRLEHSLPVVGCKKGKGSVELGLQALNDFDIFIDPSCKHLIAHCNSYRWNDEGKLIGTRHGVDSLRYSIQRFNPEPSDGGVVYLALHRKQADSFTAQLEFIDP